MKKTIIFTIIFVICLLLIASVYGFKYKNIEYLNYTQAIEEKTVNSDSKLIEDGTIIANNIINTLNPNLSKTFTSESNISISEGVDNAFNSNYILYSTDNFKVKLLKDDLSLYDYLSLEDVPSITSFDKNICISKVNELYKNLNLPEDYDLVYTEKFDNQLVELDYQKKYGDSYSKYEAVKILYSPSLEKIIILKVFNLKYENSVQKSVNISKEEAIKLAKDNLSNSQALKNVNTSGTEKVEEDFIRPNNLFSTSRKIDDDVLQSNDIRKAWKVTIGKTVTYIDYYSGEILGGDFLK